MKRAIFPASFDPMTNGHLDIATRACALFDEVVIAVYKNPDKRVLFSWDERIAMVLESTTHLTNARVEGFTGLMVEYAVRIGAEAIVRGLRAGSDFEGEFQMALANRMLAPSLETICLIGSQHLMFISSSRIKEIALLGGNVDNLVPSPVAPRLAGLRQGEP
ncbi:MAG TPA: pantetheine-phosphate adenylyltransferase [Chloroflexota bacterium]